MPEWLKRSEAYAPGGDKDTFINKSILSLLRLISQIRAQDGAGAAKNRVDPFFRVIFTLALIALVSLSRETAFLFAALTYVLAQVAILPLRAMRGTLKFAALATVFSFVLLLPAAFFGNRYSLVTLPVKLFISVAAVNILRLSKWDALIGALKRFHVPDMFIFLLDITVKYIFMLGEFTLLEMQALRLRSVGHSSGRYGTLAGVAGNLFLKSREMAEETHWAMECRGFTGRYRVPGRLRVTAPDAVYSAVGAAVIFLYFYLGRR
jgi:cobalt/nickel transport system permease protein